MARRYTAVFLLSILKANISNEWFAKDTSRKVKAAFKAKFATGQRIGAYAPIGYRKHPEIKNKLIIDEEPRWIVEKIFDLAIHGRGAASITRILIAEKVPTPGFINFQRDGTFANIYAGAPEEKKLRMDDSAGQEHYER